MATTDVVTYAVSGVGTLPVPTNAIPRRSAPERNRKERDRYYLDHPANWIGHAACSQPYSEAPLF